MHQTRILTGCSGHGVLGFDDELALLGASSSGFPAWKLEDVGHYAAMLSSASSQKIPHWMSGSEG